jgi:hypothetical protein
MLAINHLKKFKACHAPAYLMFYLVIFITVNFINTAKAQQRENRVALVIGNSAYKQSPLRNPVNDARDMADKLRTAGFSVIERNNLGVRQIGSTLREFRSKLTPGSVAVVFYAGHGLQIKGENYFPAVDSEIEGEEDVPNQSLAIRQIYDVLRENKTRLNLIFLDACRDNPYSRSFRSSYRGLAKEIAPSGTLISFATRPGGVAADGSGRNGIYTGALLRAINVSDRPIEQILKNVVTDVKAESGGAQEPWIEGSIEGEFCFGSCMTIAQPAIGDDRALWDSVKESRNLDDFRAYLNKFPNGLFSEVASNRIMSMSKIALSASPQPLKATTTVGAVEGESELDFLYGKIKGGTETTSSESWLTKVLETSKKEYPELFYFDQAVASNDNYYLIPKSIKTISGGRITLKIKSIKNQNFLIFKQKNESQIDVAFDCSKRLVGVYAGVKIENGVPLAPSVYGDPQYISLMPIPLGSVFDHAASFICTHHGMMKITSVEKMKDLGWQFAFNTSDGNQVFTNKKYVRKWEKSAEVTLKTVVKNSLKLDHLEFAVDAIFQRYRIECQTNTVQIDSEQYSSSNLMLVKSNAYGPNAVQAVSPNSTGSLAVALGCER